MNEVEKEILDMIETLEKPAEAPQESPPAETPPESPPAEAAPAETPPSQEAPPEPPAKPSEEPPAELKPPEEKVPETPPISPESPPTPTPPARAPSVEDMEKAWAEREKALMAQIAELSTKASGAPAVEKPPETPPEPKMQMFEFFKAEEEVDKALNTKDGVNELLSRVIHTATEHVMRNIPGMVVSVARGQAALVNMVKDFYTENKDLVPHKAFVGYVANQLQAANPGWPTDKLFEEAEKEVRTKLGIKKQAMASAGAGAPPATPNPPVPPAGGGPAFAAGAQTRRPSGSSGLTQQQKQILDLLE